MGREEKDKLQVEAYDYVQYSLRRYHNHQLHGYLQMDGTIDEIRLQRAVVASFQDLPQLCASFVKGRWVENEAKDRFVIPVKEGPFGKEERAAYFSGTTLLHEPYQIKITIFRKDGKDIVAVIINNMLCDGLDFKRYLYLLCELYNAVDNEAAVNRYIGLPRDIAWVRKAKVKNRRSRKRKVRERISIEQGKNSYFLTETVPEDKVKRIKEYTKKHGITVDDYFLTAYYQAVKKVYSYPLHSICFEANLRRYYAEERGLSNQTGNMFCTVKEAGELTIEELSHVIHAVMEAEVANKYCLKQLKHLNRVVTYLPKKLAGHIIDEMMTSPKVSFANFGTIEEDKLIFGGVETNKCYITGSLKKAPNLELYASSFRNEVTFGINMLTSKKANIKLTYFLQIYYVCLMEEIIP